MRDIIGRIVSNPWVYRLTCAAVTLAAMVGVGLGLRALKATGDRTLVLSVCLPIIALAILFGRWMDRRGVGPE